MEFFQNVIRATSFNVKVVGKYPSVINMFTNTQKVGISILFGALLLVTFLPNLAMADNGDVKEFIVIAKRFEFNPGRIVVNQGDTVVLTLRTDDVSHGFYLDGYNIAERYYLGEDSHVTFVADKPGKFRIRCSETCGALHHFMVGEFVVLQNDVNYIFYGSLVGISIVAILSTVLMIRRND